MADIPGDRRNDDLDWKDYVDSLFAKVQRDVDVARETVPKGIPWQDHVLLKIADESRLRDEMVLRLTERANAQDHLAEVVTSNAAKNVDTANTAAEKAIARTE